MVLVVLGHIVIVLDIYNLTAILLPRIGLPAYEKAA